MIARLIRINGKTQRKNQWQNTEKESRAKHRMNEKRKNQKRTNEISMNFNIFVFFTLTQLQVTFGWITHPKNKIQQKNVF